MRKKKVPKRMELRRKSPSRGRRRVGRHLFAQLKLHALFDPYLHSTLLPVYGHGMSLPVFMFTGTRVPARSMCPVRQDGPAVIFFQRPTDRMGRTQAKASAVHCSSSINDPPDQPAPDPHSPSYSAGSTQAGHRSLLPLRGHPALYPYVPTWACVQRANTRYTKSAAWDRC